MNLLDKGTNKLLIFLGFLFIIGCDDTSEIGLGINPDADKISIRYTSLPLSASNIYIDSVRTDMTQRLTAGIIDDPVFGNITSTAYTQFNLALGSSFLAGSDATLDSMVLKLRVASFQGADYNRPQRFSIHQMADTLYNGVTYLSKLRTPYSPTALGTASLQLIPDSVQYLYVKLSGAFVDTLFQRSKALISESSFKSFFKGLVVVPAPENTVMVDFDPINNETQLMMHHQIPSLNRDSALYSLRFNGESTVRYNHYQINRSNSTITDVQNGAEFTMPDNNIYFQSGSGIYPVLDFSVIKHFMDTAGAVVLNRVEIEMRDNLYHHQRPYILPPDEVRYLFLKNGKINGPATLTQPALSMVLDDQSYLGSGAVPASHLYDGAVFQSYRGTLTIFSELYTQEKITLDKLVVVPRVVGSLKQAAFHKDSFRIKIFYTKVNPSGL